MRFRYRRIFPSSNPPFELPRSFNDFALHPNFHGRSRKPWERSGKRKRKKVRSKTRKHHQLPFFTVTACTKSEIRRPFATSSMDFTVGSCKRIDANNTAGETTDRRRMKTVQQIQHAVFSALCSNENTIVGCCSEAAELLRWNLETETRLLLFDRLKDTV